MSKTDETLSLQFYQYLNNIIGSEDVVKTRRNIFYAIEFGNPNSSHIMISSGSKAEGLDLKDSDYDQMYVCVSYRVYNNTKNVSTSSNRIPIIMDSSNTKPGFTKLKMYNMSRAKGDKFCEIEEGKAYFSSKLFREHNMTNEMIIHGPCQSTLDGLYDFAHCFRCKEWIKQAEQWIYRPRSSWPDYKLVSSIVQYGVLFVPVGCKGSSNEDYEFRISFSMAEKQLIFSFSHTQLLCYALMKIILKDIIKTKHGDLICSYFLKTIMFWISEESSPSKWQPVNMIPCFINCIKRLIYCVQYKTCLHYFIPEYNLFECRFTDYQHKCLLDTLHEIYHSLWTNVFHTDTFQSFIAKQRASSSAYLTVSALSCLIFTTFVYRYSDCLVNITLFLKIKDNDLSTYMKSLIFNELIHLMNNDKLEKQLGRIKLIMINLRCLTDSNKFIYSQYQTSFKYFKAGLHCNATSGWSLLASLFYKHKRFNECIDIINYTLSNCTPDKIVLRLGVTLMEQTFFQKIKNIAGFLTTCKHFIIQHLRFPSPFNLLPVELMSLIEPDGGDVSIPPVVYLNTLSFLCSHHLKDNRGKQTALQDLGLTIRERYLMDPNKIALEVAKQCLSIVESIM